MKQPNLVWNKRIGPDRRMLAHVRRHPGMLKAIHEQKVGKLYGDNARISYLPHWNERLGLPKGALLIGYVGENIHAILLVDGTIQEIDYDTIIYDYMRDDA